MKPILVKAGTKLVATWVYDNSVHNAANPDPTRNVTWGEQTPDEMMYFRLNYRWADETTAHPRNDLQAKLMESPYLIVPTNTKVKMGGEIAKVLAKDHADMKNKFVFQDWKKINEQRSAWIERFNREIKV